jgi:hypothetical protein
MSSSAFHGLFDMRPSSSVASPAPTYQKGDNKAPASLRDVCILPDIELDTISPSKSRTEDVAPGKHASTGAQTPKTPNELEMSRPPSLRREDAVGLMRTWNDSPMTKWRILCCCLIYFSNGVNDSGMRLPPYRPWSSYSTFLNTASC